MAEKTGKTQQQVNPVLLIVLGVVLVGFLIYYFTSQPKAPTTVASNSTPPAGQGVTDPNTNTEAVSTEPNQTVDPVTGDSIPLSTRETSKNPFLTPGMYLTETTTPAQTGDSAGNPTGTTTPTTTSPDKKPDETPVNEFRLGAIIAKSRDKLALIYYNGKGNILRENDVLKGSGYRVARIGEYSVSLVNENGEEKVLQMDEKTLKLKGGVG